MANADIDVALTYHDETKHSYDSVYRSHHFLDWDNQPRPFKSYPGLPPLPLPSPVPETSCPAFRALAGTLPSTDPARPTLADLAYVLFCAAGVTRRRHIPGYGDMAFRAAACTGALYHLELYVAVGELPDLEAGVYHFAPLDFALRRLRPGDFRQVLVEASGQEPGVQHAPVVIVGTDTFWRNAWKYRARAYRHSFWDAGTILANLLAATTARGLPARLVTGFVDEQVNGLLDLDVPREVSLFLVGLGHGTPPPAAPPVTPLALEVAPLSREEVQYPAIHLVHQAAFLERPDDVVAWRGPAPPTSLPPATGTVLPLQPEPDAQLPSEPLEAVIRRRGSTRRFARQALTLLQLSNALVAAMHDIPADFLEPPGDRLNDLYLIVHAVTGLPPGAYVYRVEEQGLELLRQGDVRHEAGLLALGQDLAADASVNVYFLCDLEPVLERFGNRGYRVAQLEAGIRAGRLYLAAYAQGFGATGLTFFDDDVTTFFSPHGAGKRVMFLLAMGHAARRRRR